MLNRFSFHFFLLLSLLSCSILVNVSFAKTKEKHYEVEVVVFSNRDLRNYEAESWPVNPGSPKTKNIIELISQEQLLLDDNMDKLKFYYLEPSDTDKSEDNLSKMVRKLNDSPNYELLIHKTWRQKVTSKKKTPYIYLDDAAERKLEFGPNFSTPDSLINEMNPDSSAEEQLLNALLAEEQSLNKPTFDGNPFFISEFDPIEPLESDPNDINNLQLELSPYGPPQHLVYGIFKLYQERYLHVKADFLFRGKPYTPPEEDAPLEESFPMKTDDGQEMTASENENAFLLEPKITEEDEEALQSITPEKPPIVGYRLKSSKRIRLARTYYFDHPLFGIITRVSRYEPPLEADAESTNE